MPLDEGQQHGDLVGLGSRFCGGRHGRTLVM